MLYVGVTDPLGGINQLFPLFGIANQLLAAIALTLCVTLFCKHGWWKYVWVPAVPLVWDLIVTMTASYQKVFSDNPAIGYLAQADRYRAARDAGEVLAPATDASQMDTVITNSTVNAFLQASFALLVIVIVANAALIWFKAAKAGSLPTTEVPKTESHVVAPGRVPRHRRGEEGRGRVAGLPRPQGDGRVVSAPTVEHPGPGTPSAGRRALVRPAAQWRGQVGRLPRSTASGAGSSR